MIDRKELLVAIAEAGELTAERSLSIRQSYDTDIPGLVYSWELKSPKVLKLLGIVTQGRQSKVFLQEVESQIDAFLMLQDLEGGAEWVEAEEAERVRLSDLWTKLTLNIPPQWCVGVYPFRVGQIIAKIGEPGWEYMGMLVKNNILPYGLDTQGRFLLVDGKTMQ